ncbi:MAG: YcxB family protein [Clostridium sp.]|jgi:hypothetical protein|nr:YcxB family protein [Clostridium sp.]
MLELDVTIKADDLYDYMLYHFYHNAAGILGSGFGALLVVGGTLRQQWIFVIGGAVLLLYLPWTLFLKSRRQTLRNPAFRRPLHYCLDEEGITVSQGETVQKQEWKDLQKAVSTGKSVIVYTTAVSATIFPRRELGERCPQVIQFICTHMPPSKVKIRS